MPATIVGRTGEQIRFWVHVTHGDPAEVWLQLEDGTVRGGVRAGRQLHAAIRPGRTVDR